MSLYDPLDPSYYEPAATRGERDRTFQKCSDCRVCVKLCPSFKSLFQMIDAYEDGAGDVTVLTDAEHRRVVDECYQCKLCYVICPYTPDQGQEWKIDFPRLMLRSLAVQQRTGQVAGSARLLARTDLQGKVATTFAPVVNRMAAIKPARVVMEKLAGISRVRMLPTYARTRFSKWFRLSPRLASGTRSTVALFPTCLVEYQEPSVGRALVAVCERNGIACELPAGQVCCGMPWLDAGDTGKFVEQARQNVDALLPAVEAGRPVVVPQPTCAYVIKNEYPDFLGTEEARKVAGATYDAAEYLMKCHKEEPLDTDFTGPVSEKIVWQAACHYRAQQMGPKSRDLMALTGAKVQMLDRCSAIDGTWGLRAGNVEMAKKVARPLMDAVSASEADIVAGDCHLSNTAILEETGRRPWHPLEVLARAYGLSEREGE